MFLSISTQIHIFASKVMTQTCDLVLSHEHTVAHPYQIHWDTGKETTLEAPSGHSLEDHQKAKRPLGLAAQDHNSVRSSTPFPTSWNRCHMIPPKKKWWISRPEWTRMIPGPGGATPGLPQRIEMLGTDGPNGDLPAMGHEPMTDINHWSYWNIFQA